ncbi:Excision repair cross-complementation group 1 [Sparganum proliferum]
MGRDLRVDVISPYRCHVFGDSRPEQSSIFSEVVALSATAPDPADQPSDSGTGGKSRFELLEESFGSPVVSGLQLFSNYREGLVDPESICTQPVASKPTAVVAPPSLLGSKTAEGPRVPASWLKPRHPPSGSSFGKLCGAPPLLQLSPVKEASTSQGVPQKVPLTDLPDPSRGTRLTSQAAANVSSSKLLVNSRQRGNPLLELLRNVAWEYADIQPDYLFGPSQCAFFLSLRYHNLNPEYIFDRLQKIREAYKLTVLIVLVDVDDSHHPLKELDKFGLTQNVTVMLAWSPTEAARYLETFKTSINKPPDDLLPDGDAKNDHLALVTGFLTSLRHISKSDAAALLTKFGSVAGIMKADVESLESCPGIGGVKAQKLHDTLRATFKRKNLE